MEKYRKVLVIRYHAFGDIITILPYVNALKEQLPDARFYLLTMKVAETIPSVCTVFDEILSVWGGKNSRKARIGNMLKCPIVMMHKFDLIVDLQNDRKSKLIKRVLGSKQPSTFERTAPVFGGERYRLAMERLGFPDLQPIFKIDIKPEKATIGHEKLYQKGYQDHEKLIVINPAGFYITRNWPLKNYLELLELMVANMQEPFKVLLIGDDRIQEKANVIEKQFPRIAINLVNGTSQIEALNILRKVDLIFSEDSGLAHMSWIQGIRTLLMLGSTRADWIAPPYSHVTNLTSSDLDCGNCMKETCIHGDVRCLTRYSPNFIYEKIQNLLRA